MKPFISILKSGSIKFIGITFMRPKGFSSPFFNIGFWFFEIRFGLIK